MKLYHGSNIEVKNPKILTSARVGDFGPFHAPQRDAPLSVAPAESAPQGADGFPGSGRLA